MQTITIEHAVDKETGEKIEGMYDVFVDGKFYEGPMKKEVANKIVSSLRNKVRRMNSESSSGCGPK